MKAKKSYGQHFLVEESIAERIAHSLAHQSDYNTLIEIGPGKGMLSKYLLDQCPKLYLVEADRDMIRYLHQHYPNFKDNIIPADFLKLDLSPFILDQPFAIIGNFPYNISSQIIFKALDHSEQMIELVGMFQKEVAQRICSPPGSKAYGVISVLTQYKYQCEYLFGIGPEHFAPPPKVNSAVIRLSKKKNPPTAQDESLFRSVVKQTFGQRRKMIRNTLKSFGIAAELLQEKKFTLRPEQLSVEDFIALSDLIIAQRQH